MTVDNIVCSNSRRVPTVDGGNCAGGGGEGGYMTVDNYFRKDSSILVRTN